MTKRTPVFEHTECSRCGGSGQFSFNLMHGSVCHGCSGTGFKLTLRGRAAQHFVNELREIPIENFQVGDSIRFDGFNAGSFVQPTKWAKVTSVQFLTRSEAGYYWEDSENPNCVRLETTYGSVTGFVGKTKYRKGFSAEQKQQQIDQALQYQATLTKFGKPRKQKLAA
jgi:hypothetical protein